MLSKHNPIQRDQLEMITLNQLVPASHLVRKIEAALDFSFIYDLVKDMYSEIGRPSIDPVILIKLTFLQYTFGIRSMRQTIEQVETNMAYRWFLGYGFHDKVPHFSTFGKNYERRFKDTDLFEQIFAKRHARIRNAFKKRLTRTGKITEKKHFLRTSLRRKRRKKSKKAPPIQRVVTM
ncbi:hypothetical protein NRS6120_11930 [Bacillus subtilis]|nr:hypothetical protein NRS6120_11845 [Bacillus subtilis]CAI6278317.1 hypothetical protein NRS6120_11930 [Bacillus subtilis]